MDAPFLTDLSCKFGSRYTDAVIGPVLNLLLFVNSPLVFLFSWAFVLVWFWLNYSVFPINTTNSSNDYSRDSMRALLFAFLFYYISAFLLILFTHNNGCITLFEKQALLTRMGPALARQISAMQSR